jgi:hypothetical protein
VLPPYIDDRNDFRYTIVDLKDGSYSISFFVGKVGDFLLHVRVDGDDVAGSPFKIHVRPGKPLAAFTQVNFDRLFRVLPGSLVELVSSSNGVVEAELKIVTCDGLGNRTYSARVPVAARGGGGVKIKDLVDYQDGNFSAFLEISADGRLDLLVDGLHVRGSPFTIRVPADSFSSSPRRMPRWPAGTSAAAAGNFQEQLLGEREEAVEEGERRLAEIKRDLDAKYRKFPIVVDSVAYNPPPATEAATPVKNPESPKGVEFVKEMETRLATLRAKEEEVEKLLAEVNREKAEAEAERRKREREDGEEADEQVSRLKAIYARKDEWLERRREEVEQLVKRREKEKKLEDWNLDETMNKVGFMKQNKIRMEKDHDIVNKIRYTVDWLFANFVSHEKAGISMTDAVTMVHKARLPMDSAEVVDAFIDFIKETPTERVVSRQKLLNFLALLAKLTYRDTRPFDDQLASLFEDYLFPMVIQS